MSKLKVMNNNNMQTELLVPKECQAQGQRIKLRDQLEKSQKLASGYKTERDKLKESEDKLNAVAKAKTPPAANAESGNTKAPGANPAANSQSFLNGTDTLPNSFSVIKSLTN